MTKTKTMKIEIARSYSRTIQIAPYEPINVFCSRKSEFEGTDAEAKGESERLFLLCVADVEADIKTMLERSRKQTESTL